MCCSDACLQVAPKRAALAAAQESLDKTLAELANAQARLLAVQEKIAALEAQFEEATAKKASLAAQVRHTSTCLPGGMNNQVVKLVVRCDSLAYCCVILLLCFWCFLFLNCACHQCRWLIVR